MANKILMSFIKDGVILKTQEKEYRNDSEQIKAYFDLIARAANKGYRNAGSVSIPREDRVRTMFNSAKGQSIVIRRF